MSRGSVLHCIISICEKKTQIKIVYAQIHTTPRLRKYDKIAQSSNRALCFKTLSIARTFFNAISLLTTGYVLPKKLTEYYSHVF